MSEELLLADIDDVSEDEAHQSLRTSKSGAWDTIQTDIKVESSQQLDSGDHDEDGSIDSRPSSSQASGKTVLTAIAQVHDNKALDLSSEEEALVNDDGQRSTTRPHSTLSPEPINEARKPKQPSRPHSRSSGAQEPGVITVHKAENGGGVGFGGVGSFAGPTSINVVRSSMAEIQKDTDVDLRKPSLSNMTILDSRRPSIAETSEGSRSQTPHSDTRSYRERLRDRIATVKEKASSSVFTTQSRSRLRQKLMKQQSTISQLSDVLRKEEVQVVAALEKHNQIKSKWKTVTRASLEITQSDEAYDFFTKVWEDERPPALPQSPPTERAKSSSDVSSPKVSDPPAAPIEITSEGEDKAKLGAADYLGLKTDEAEWSLITKWMPAVDKVITGPNTWLYYPSTESVPLKQKLSENKDLRQKENEGIFIPEKPPISERNYNKVQQRLLSENNKKWFGEDGQVLREADPLLGKSYRPPLVDGSCSNGLDLIFVPALKFDLLTSNSSAAQGNVKKSLPDEKYFLEVQVLELLFTHHPLFTREHVLATILSQLYAKYVHRSNNSVAKRLEQRLSALRSAKYALVNIIQDGGGDNESKTNVEAIQKYKAQIREVRDLKFSEQKTDRDLLAQVLITWRDLKQLREAQKYACTDVKLKITQVERVENVEEYETMLNETWNEILEEATDEYEEQKKIYEEWLAVHKDDDEPPPPEEKLEPPQPVDQETLRAALMRLMAQCIGPPNEPRVIVELAHVTVTPESEITDQSELARRALLQKTSLWIKVLYNGTELVRSQSFQLRPDFTVTFNQLFTIRILQVPEMLSVEIHSEGPGKCKPLAEVYIPIPNSTSTLENTPSERREFSSSQIYFPSGTSGVGCGDVMTSGTLCCSAAWMSKDGQVYSVPAEFLDTRNTMGSRHRMDITSDVSKLKEWCDHYQLDPNDPNNAPVFSLLKNTRDINSDSSPLSHRQFRLHLLTQMFELCSAETIENNPRLMLLQLRDKGEPEFRGMRSIPLREREIPQEIFKIYEKRLQSPQFPLESLGTGPQSQQNSLILGRNWGAHTLNSIRTRVLAQCKLAQQTRTLADVISEDHVPDVATLGLTFVKWLQPERPLRPKRKERKKVPVQSLGGQEVKVVVSVVRAFEIPVRKDVDGMSEEKINLVPVRPFVEVSFEGHSARTTTAEGSNPTWNQDLAIPILPASSDFSPGALQNINSCLHVHLFDEIIVDLLEDESQRENNIHQRLERNWLGSLSIPFSTLYFNSKIEGTFRLYTPPFLLGYDRSGLNSSDEGSAYSRPSTYLTLFIMVQPPLNPPEPLREHLECSEAPYVEKYLRQFEAEYKMQFPHRDMKSLVIDVTGKCVCVTRYFRPLAPPNFGDNVTATESLVTRFVSMIPAVSGTVLFPGLFDIWLTNDQILKLLCGDCEDHAVLLMCYLLYLDITCWLLLGQGIPDGSVAFVLIRTKSDEFYIIHPVHGLKYSVHDSFSPLHKVYCLINQENIWVNIQEEEIVKRTRFDVRKSPDWLPVFNRNVATPLGSVQSNFIEYVPTSQLDVTLLQDQLEKQLRNSIPQWRKHQRTVWNRHCIAVLRKLMPHLEIAAWDAASLNGTGPPNLTSALTQLQHITASYKMCGFPINLPFTNMTAILDAVKSTGVHKSETENMEMALAVYIRSFPCNVLSVWVYVATLIRRR